MQPGFQMEFSHSQCNLAVYQPREQKTSPLLQVARSLHSAVVLMGTLHYREELISRWLPYREGRNDAMLSDAELILELYELVGSSALEELEGEFAVGVIDRNEQKLLLNRASFGHWPLYWACQNDCIYAGTSSYRIATKTRRTEPSREYLADFLTHPFPGSELPSETTPYEGVYRVQPGTILFAHAGERSRVISKLNWNDRIQSVPEISAKEAASRYRELLESAVRERITNEHPIAHLSGGMDSSSIACLAARVRASQGQDNLLTESLVYSTGGLAGERDYIRMISDHRPIKPRFLDGERCYDFDVFQQEIPPHDEPYHGLFRTAMESALTRQAQTDQATVLLSGGAAELTAEYRQYDIPDLIRSGHWVAAIREARRWSKARNISLNQTLWNQGVKRLVRPDLLDKFARWKRRNTHALENFGLHEIAPWFTPEFRKEYRLSYRATRATAPMRQYPMAQNARNFELQLVTGDWANCHLAAPLGMKVSHPFSDARLIQFALSLPASIRAVPGESKPLLQEAMRDVLPEAIRKRRYKQSFNDVFWNGLRRNLSRIEELIRSSTVHELNLFDVDQTIAAFRDHALGIGGVSVGHRLGGTLAVICWYDQLQTRVETTPTFCWDLLTHPASDTKSKPSFIPGKMYEEVS